MNLLGLLLFIACAVGLLAAPRRWAPLPLLIGCCFITTGQALMIGSVAFPVYRLLLMVGVLRIVVRGERLPGGLEMMDRLMIAWCAWTLFASFFQPFEPGSGPKYVLGAMLNIASTYLVMRVLCRDIADLQTFIRMLCLVLVPVAVAMLWEQISMQNVFSAFGRVPEIPMIRDGRIRAQGPFSHPILAGTIGATCLPLVLAIWRRHRVPALLGAGACLMMVYASSSSGPIMTLLFGLFAVGMWKYRQHCRRLRVLAVLTYLLLVVVMEKPPYYLVARINLTGASTGWHRAFLIEQTINHFDEWVWVGTNRTRHWMPRQGAISPNHTDITNYYISFGVLGGFLCMALVIAMLWRAFRSVGMYVRHPATTAESCFVVWCVGACLAAHAATSISVAYFGQAQFFFWIPLAVIPSLLNSAPRHAPQPVTPAENVITAGPRTLRRRPLQRTPLLPGRASP